MKNIKVTINQAGMVVDICNPSTLGGQRRSITKFKPSLGN